MAFSFSRTFNTERLFDIDTSDFEYKSLEDLLKEGYTEDDEIPIRGLYINTRGKFDDAPVAALDDCYVNLPAHLTGNVNKILSDSRAIKAINNGNVGFKIRPYYSKKYEKDCYSIDWVDL